jgi:hypothetical protein
VAFDCQLGPEHSISALYVLAVHPCVWVLDWPSLRLVSVHVVVTCKDSVLPLLPSSVYAGNAMLGVLLPAPCIMQCVCHIYVAHYIVPRLQCMMRPRGSQLGSLS